MTTSLKISILGTGIVGETLATAFASRGFQIIIGTRDPNAEKIKPLLERVGKGAKAATFKDAVHSGDVVLLATDNAATESAINLATTEAFNGKIVWDIINPLGRLPNGIPELSLTIGLSDSHGEKVQRLLPGAHVVKALNTIGNALMVSPPAFYGSVKPDTWICGNNATAKFVIASLLVAIGWDRDCILDVGPIIASRALEPLSLVFIYYAFTQRSFRGHALKLLRNFPSPQPSQLVTAPSAEIPPSTISGSKIAILGTGIVGVTLAKGFVAKGHPVIFGTRDPSSDKSKEILTEVGSPLASIATFQEASKAGDVIVLAINGQAAGVLDSLAVDDSLNGKVIIDAVNPISGKEGTLLLYNIGCFDSFGELVQRKLPNAHVVKCFSILGNGFMVNPHDFNGLKPDMFIAGNNDKAKDTARQVLGEFGWSPDCILDYGDIKSSRFLEPIAQLWCQYGFATNTWDHAFKLLRN